MVLSFVKKNHPLILFTAPILAVIPFLITINYDHIFSGQLTTNVFLWFAGLFDSIAYAWIIVPYGLIIAVFFLLVKMNSRYIFIESRTFLDGIVFLFLALSLFPLRVLNPAHISGIFLMLTFFSLFRLEKETNIRVAFDTGFILSAGSLFHWQLIYYLIPVWIAFSVIKTMSFREYLVSLAGIIVPYMFYFFWFFWNDDIQGFVILMKQQNIFDFSIPVLNLRETIYFSSLVLFFLICLLASMSSMKAKKIIRRKYFTIFFILVFYSFILCMVRNFDTSFIIISLPWLSVLLANFFILSKSRFFTELVFTIMAGVSLYNIFTW
ncbi:MAG: hypothetical protein A2W91_13175 [Bacteroidetes bacterium GWF2_38_335]|nr:MAG: hypothetical protein A2W91_13175 [Bacteroidetes bacterium GWF2_38_335]OFY77206.1 MAG: hypothetical protein A2281_14840 [Bacteroidetes bacterium RIFOXYA12_FULL_38_20]HBS85792.1 hypothetical protein [Bacteroidales bacterium]